MNEIDIDGKQSKFFDFISKTIEQNHKLSHAYLVETNGCNNYMIYIKELIKKILLLNQEDEKKIKNICHSIDQDTYPDLKFIRPEGSYWIKKEQLIQLEKSYSKKSMLDNYLIYVIDSAEFLNDSSANTILKFLEEPADGIVAILVATNKFHVINTLVSRCQILSLHGNSDLTEVDPLIQSFVENFNYPEELLLHFDDYLNSLFNEKSEMISNLDKVEILLSQILSSKIMGNDSFSNFSFDETCISKILLVIEQEKTKLQFNLNIKLWYHNFIVRLMEVISCV